MRFIRGLNHFKPDLKGCAVTIGCFDGVHLGHQAVINQLQTEARQLKVPSLVMSFEPQPKDFFQPQKALARLTRLREKIHMLQTTEVDAFLLLRFDHALASLTAEEFIQQILVETLAVTHVVVGDDFQFGKGRTGNFASLQRHGQKLGFEVSKTVTHVVDGVRASSTGIRASLADGQLEVAAKMLGRPYSMSGRVAYGQQKGRTIGFPTANIHLFRRRSPIRGVYAVEVSGLDELPLPGVANIGNRPTVESDGQWVLEVHLFNFQQMIYGEYLSVNFLKKIRDEKKFASFPELKMQIEHDALVAKDFFHLTS